MAAKLNMSLTDICRSAALCLCVGFLFFFWFVCLFVCYSACRLVFRRCRKTTLRFQFQQASYTFQRFDGAGRPFLLRRPSSED